MNRRWQLLGVVGLTGLMVAPILGASVGTAAAAPGLPIIVTNTNDSGPGSLRSAIDLANRTAGHDTITFALRLIPARPYTITPLTALSPARSPTPSRSTATPSTDRSAPPPPLAPPWE